MDLLKTIKSDFSRFTKPTFINFIKYYTFPRGGVQRYTIWFRIMQKVKSKKLLKFFLGLPVYLIHRHYEYKYGIHANTNISVGDGLFIVHGDGVFLNCKRIGKNFTVYQGVTLGCNKDGIPTIEDNVRIYTNAVVVGDITIHSGAVIGANSFVNKDVPENTLVAGNPARIIKQIQ